MYDVIRLDGLRFRCRSCCFFLLPCSSSIKSTIDMLINLKTHIQMQSKQLLDILSQTIITFLDFKYDNFRQV